MDDHRHEFPVERMCRMLEVSLSGYYAWRGRPESDHAQEDTVLSENIKFYFERSRENYGTLRLKADLAQEAGLQVSRRRIGRLMKAANLEVRSKRKFRTTTRSKDNSPVAENILNRDFYASAPNQKWTTDITYLPCMEGWLYLATVMDLYSRKIVGWAMHDRLDTLLVTEALQMALNRRRPGAGLLHHSDRGSHYASAAYRQALQRLEAVQSMSRKGNCWDNSVQESFFATLKTEMT
ncbi:IS3 family transposase [Deinococcus malanensis]|uniref:IS3 family transposase n=1 Tax=Deinococcus malanensis TaxID=1706855 RepID=UPI001E606D57